MTRERWEARSPSGSCERRFTSRSEAVRWIQVRALAGETIVHVRTYRVEVMYAWRAGRDRDDAMGGAWWSGMWRYATSTRTLYTDPLGKHSRRRAKAAAIAAKPAGPCVLVAIRRRVRG